MNADRSQKIRSCPVKSNPELFDVAWEFDVLRSTHNGSLIDGQASASVLTQPTPTWPPRGLHVRTSL